MSKKKRKRKKHAAHVETGAVEVLHEDKEMKSEALEESKAEEKVEKTGESKTERAEKAEPETKEDYRKQELNASQEQAEKTETGALNIEESSRGDGMQGEEESFLSKAPWKKILKITGGAAVLVVVGIYVGGVVYFQDRFFPNTKINGINASHCTVDDIEAAVAEKMKSYQLLLLERDGDREWIKASQINYRYLSNGEVQEFLDCQNPWTWPASAWKEYSNAFSASAVFDEKLLEETVSSLKCFSPEVEVEPQDAYIKFKKTTYKIAKETEGKKVRKKRLIKVLKTTISEGKTQLDLEEENCYAKPAVRKSDKKLNRLVKNLNQYAKTKVTYLFGERSEVLDGSRIKDWLSYDEEGNVTLDESQIPAYVAELAEKYDTYDKARNFKTHDGSYVEVEGGHYGWKIDQEEESAQLLELVKAGTATERTAVFAQTAVSFENSDLGDSYVEIDLTNQHLWMYLNGEEIVSSDFVSGDMSKPGRRTPPGTFTLYYKKSPAVLRSNTPGDSYESPVTYWMPFNGGIGLHDANWRGSFGGSIYKYNGSHGCINLPTQAAKKIYENIEKGFPIICYYR